MAAIVELSDVTFTYKHRSQPSIKNVSLQVQAGDFLLLTGPTGCGKSTLLKTLNGLVPQESGGSFSGRVRVNGADTACFSIAQLSQLVGMVFQSPDDQIFSSTVFDETAFVLENMGLSETEIAGRVQEALRFVGLEKKRGDSVHTLSGGQKQRLAVASVLAARPCILALDEPISQLDPQGADELLQVLGKVNAELGITVIIVEHRLHEVMPLCRTVAVMQDGSIIWQGSREEAFRQPGLFTGHGLRVPQTVAICSALEVPTGSAAVADAVTAIRRRYRLPETAGDRPERQAACQTQTAVPAIQIDKLNFRYDDNGPVILPDLSLTISRGRFVMLMGNNGAGKSTLLHLISGLIPYRTGTVTVLDRPVTGISSCIGMVLQNPDFMLFNSTVREEVGFSINAGGWTPKCHELAGKLRLCGMENDFPLALSRGQRLRVAIAAVLAAEPQVLLLDEPTTGQDIGHIEDIILLLQEFTRRGGTVLFCTHDAEVAARYGDEVVVLCQGQVIAQASPADVFSREDIIRQAGLKAPAALLTARALYGGTAMTVKEVVDYVRQKCVGSHTA